MNVFQKKIYDIIKAYGGSATRPTIGMELYDSVTKNRTTLYDALYKMLKDGVLDRVANPKTGYRGRPLVEWIIIKEGL